MTLRLDLNRFVGVHPFRAWACASVEDCLADLQGRGFDGAVVSAWEAIFQEDSWIAEQRLAAAIAGRPELRQFAIVDPTRPRWRADLERAAAEWNIRGIRLCSLYHGYSLAEAPAGEVFRIAVDLELPILVMCRMQDIRMQRGILAVEPPLEEIVRMLETFPDHRIALAGLSFAAALSLADTVNPRHHVWLDTSRLQGPWRTFEKLFGCLHPDRVAFGSLWPLNLPDCPLTQLIHAGLDESVVNGVLGGNAAGFLGGRSG